MANGRFSIINAVRQGWAFTWAQRGYLARVSVLPLGLQAATSLLLQYYDADASMVEAFLWTFPANVAFAWLMFAEARLALLDERMDRLPQDGLYLAARQRQMKLAVIILLLFDMAVTAAGAVMEWAMKSGTLGVSAAVSLVVLFLIGGLVWGLRFSVLHILAAVGYPLRGFLTRVEGLGISARLLGMGLLCALPVYMALEIALGLLLPEGAAELTPAQTSAAILISAPVVLLVPVLLNAAAVFALKEMLGKELAA